MFLKEKSSQLKPTKLNVSKVIEFLNNYKPDTIFVPFINDKHLDHINTNIILSNALSKCLLNLKKLKIFSYEVWSFVPYNIYNKINDTIEKKTTELLKYKTGMKVVDYKRFCNNLSIYHSICIGNKIGNKEVFYYCDGDKYLDLVKTNSKSATINQVDTN